MLFHIHMTHYMYTAGKSTIFLINMWNVYMLIKHNEHMTCTASL